MEDEWHMSDGDDFQDDDDFAPSPQKKAKKKVTKKKKTKKKTKKVSGKENSQNNSPAPKKRKASSKSEKEPKKKKSGKAEEVAMTGKALILKYMNEQNRPYSHTHVFENLRRQVKKSHVPRLLDELAAEGKLTLKAFKKNKVYMADQSQYPDVTQAELDQMDADIKGRGPPLAELATSVTQLQRECGFLESQPTDEEADALLVSLEQKRNTLAEKLANIEANQGLMSKADLDAIQTKFNLYYKAWKKRKKAEKEMIETLCEGNGKKPKKNREVIGIETDEEYEVNIDTYTPLFKKISK